MAIWDLPVDMFARGTSFMYSHPGRTVTVERLADSGPARAFLPFVHKPPQVSFNDGAKLWTVTNIV